MEGFEALFYLQNYRRRKNFFEVRGQWHAPSKKFANSALGFEECVLCTDMNTPEN